MNKTASYVLVYTITNIIFQSSELLQEVVIRSVYMSSGGY